MAANGVKSKYELKEAGSQGQHDDVQDFSKDENEERGNWSGRFDFILSCLGYAVGLGNVWRFPYLCYRNGGAVFFIPYVIALFFVGMPIFFLELSLGQFTSSGPTTCWKFAKFFKGIGWAMVIVSALVGIYYNMIIAWALYYFVASFIDISKGDRLPWDHCGSWSSPFCEHNLDNNITKGCLSYGYIIEDGICKSNYGADGINNGTIYGITDIKVAKAAGYAKRSSAEDYLYSRVLRTGPQGNGNGFGLGNMGEIHWDLVLSLLGAWIIVCLSLIKGVKSSGKVVYFTAIFPYAVLIILLIRGLMLDGYKQGIIFYIQRIQWEKLKEVSVWKDATVQIFFSLSASWGGLIALSSYNRFHNDCLRDSVIVSLANCFTSFFAGFVIFSYIGHLAHTLDVPVDDVAKSGVGLAFTIYPTAVSTIPGSPFWAILFFLMLITLGLDSEFALVETVVTAIEDEIPSLRKKKAITVFGVSGILFLCGLPLCMNGGERLLSLMDDYSGGWNVLLIAVFECISIGYVYGFIRFSEDIRIMLGTRNCSSYIWSGVKYWWGICWCLFTPLLCLALIGYTWYDYNKTIDGKKEAYGGEWYLLGWAFTMSVVIAIFVTGAIMLCSSGKSFTPTVDWGPALVKHRQLVTSYIPNYIVDPWGAPINDKGVGIPVTEQESYLNQAYEPTKF